jgi:uncharacterized membrane protein
VGYPLLPWLSVLVLGLAFGRWLALAQPAATRVAGRLAAAGSVALALFVLVRRGNGYGNMGLAHADDSIVQWLHVSKYPPSLSYLALELGIMALVLALFFVWPARGRRPLRVLSLFGQTALFFYLLHAHLLAVVALALGVYGREGLAATYVATLGALVVLYPICKRYRAYKASHPEGWARYV